MMGPGFYNRKTAPFQSPFTTIKEFGEGLLLPGSLQDKLRTFQWHTKTKITRDRRGLLQRELLSCARKAKRKAAGLTSFLIPKKTIRPTARNIRTRDKSGRIPQVAKEMMHYIIGLLTQSETRWFQTGEQRMTTGPPPPLQPPKV